jgi:hypothetical protein
MKVARLEGRQSFVAPALTRIFPLCFGRLPSRIMGRNARPTASTAIQLRFKLIAKTEEAIAF